MIGLYQQGGRIKESPTIELDPRGIEVDRIYQKRMPTKARAGNMENYYYDQEIAKDAANMAVSWKEKPANERAKEWAKNAAWSIAPELVGLGIPAANKIIGGFKKNPLIQIAERYEPLVKRGVQALGEANDITNATASTRPYINTGSSMHNKIDVISQMISNHGPEAQQILREELPKLSKEEFAKYAKQAGFVDLGHHWAVSPSGASSLYKKKGGLLKKK